MNKKGFIFLMTSFLFIVIFISLFFNHQMTYKIVKNQSKLEGSVEEKIPDANFRACLTELVQVGSKSEIDSITGESYTVYYTSGGTKYDELTDANLKEVVGVYCENRKISNIKGIELLSNVVDVNLSNNPIKKISLSSTTNSKVSKLWIHSVDIDNFDNDFSVDNTFANNLTLLDVGNNHLSSSDANNIITKYKNLTDLSFRGNTLSSAIDVSGLSHLKNLWLDDTGITSITGVNNLEILNIANTGVKTLDLSTNSKLVMLTTSGCNISNLDLSSASKLKYLYANSMDLKSLKFHDDTDLLILDVSSNKDFSNSQFQSWIDKFKNLRVFIADSNNLDSLNFQDSTKLEVLNLSHNNLHSLVLPSSNNLKELNLSVNSFSSLDLSGYTNIEKLYVSSLDKLNSLDLSKNVNLVVLNAAFSGFSENLNLDNNTKLSALTLDYDYVKKMDLSKFSDLKTISLVSYNIVPIYGDNYSVSSVRGLIPSDIHFERYEFYSSFDHNTLFTSDTVQSSAGKSFPLRIRATGVSSDFDVGSIDLIFEGYYELKFIKLTSDKYFINEEKGTVEVGSDSDADIRKNLKSSYDGIVFDISGNKLLLKYNDVTIKEFTLQRVVNPKTGNLFILVVLFIMVVSFASLFVSYKRRVNNSI